MLASDIIRVSSYLEAGNLADPSNKRNTPPPPPPAPEPESQQVADDVPPDAPDDGEDVPF
jgi:hypothetical protein